MRAFSSAELAYLAERRLGRLATVDPDGLPHVVPLGWRFDPAAGTIDVTGRDLARTRKFKNVLQNPKVALVVDDVLPPWRPRAVMVRGRGLALRDARGADGEPLGAIIRITPTAIVSWGLEPSGG
ncbi:MAG TPA: PPOX class F420-dependent oxidoreductase [Candidatus Micrarchaeia archaeon]|nr:PPOX class F420-dependent oxidoreductase [Candidatus Micrarchaeia archaeon]